MNKKRKALFLDRDGVINKDINYAHRLEDLSFIPGILKLIERAECKGYHIICISNQSGVGRGYFSMDELEEFNLNINYKLSECGVANIEKFYCATATPIQAETEFRKYGFTRKPFPGNFLAARADFNLDLKNSIMVGDRLSDIVAATAAGVRNAYLLQSNEQEHGIYCGCYKKITSLSQVVIRG